MSQLRWACRSSRYGNYGPRGSRRSWEFRRIRSQFSEQLEVTALSRIRGTQRIPEVTGGHEEDPLRVQEEPRGHRRTREDTRGHDMTPVRDREDEGSNPSPPTIFVSWVQGVDATPIPKEAVACDYWNGRNSSCSGLKSELAWLSPQRRRQPAFRGARRRAGSCRLAASCHPTSQHGRDSATCHSRNERTSTPGLSVRRAFGQSPGG